MIYLRILLKPIVVLMAVALIFTVARAQLLHGVTDALSGGGSPTPPASCTGAIDASQGCPLPMLGL